MTDYFREPKKVRTRPELEKSCRMLREHNEKLKARIEVLECEVAMWRKHVVELEATIGRVIPGTPATESDWVKLVGEKEALEATIMRVEGLPDKWRNSIEVIQVAGFGMSGLSQFTITPRDCADNLEQALGEVK